MHKLLLSIIQKCNATYRTQVHSSSTEPRSPPALQSATAFSPHLEKTLRFGDVAVISLCGQRQELEKALHLVADMRRRGITPNIHTYTALINTCIKSGDYTLALDVFKTLEVQPCLLQPEPCLPNLFELLQLLVDFVLFVVPCLTVVALLGGCRSDSKWHLIESDTDGAKGSVLAQCFPAQMSEDVVCIKIADSIAYLHPAVVLQAP